MNLATRRWSQLVGAGFDQLRSGRDLESLHRLHGTPEKVAQMLALSSGVETLRQSTESCHTSANTHQLRSELRSLGAENLAEAIELVAPRVSQGSIGSVYRATFRDGRDVAIKLQHRGISKAIQTDLRALDLLALPFGGFRRLPLSRFKKVIAASLEQELDYGAERANQKDYTRILAAVNGIDTPKLHEEFCRSGILVSEWVDGLPLQSLFDHEKVHHRLKVASRIVSAFLWGLHPSNILHADPYPANFIIQPANNFSVTVLDFGATMRLETNQFQAISKLINIAREGGDALGAYLLAGFNEELLEPIAEHLQELTRILFSSFCSSRQPHISAQDRLNAVSALLGEQRLNFRLAAPPELLPLMRTWGGIQRLVAFLDVEVDWYQLWLEQFPDPDVFQPSATSVARHGPNKPLCSPKGARNLRVQVSKNGRRVAQLSFRWSVIHHLTEIIEPATLEAIAQRGIDVQRIAAKTIEEGCPPTNIFEEFIDGTRLKVWLD